VAQETQQKSPSVRAIWPFVIRNLREIVAGFLLGAVFGFIVPTLNQVGGRLAGSVFRLTNKYFGEVAVWPKRGTETLIVALSVAAIFYTIRLVDFLKKLWISWRAGLVSGIGVSWFLASALTFSFFNLTGSSLFLFLLAFGVAGTLLVFYRDLRIGGAAESLSEADPDRPISESEEDIVGRGPVVGSIVRAIVNDVVPVVALTGAFGDGKTSVLNLLSKALQGREDVLLVRFSTWLPMDEETLVSTLLNSVLGRLETRFVVPKIKRNLMKFTRTFFAVLPGVPASIKDLFEKPSQSEQIAELRRNLSSLPVRVAILLDDIDRMHKNELDTMLKLIRGVPEFPQLTYVCAFHPHALVQTLRGGPSVKSGEEAEQFLEKFFPDQIQLPKIEESLLAVEFEKRFFAICDRNTLLVEPEERQKFKDDLRTLWQMSLKGYFTNLRQVKLFTNRLNRSLPIVGQEVNLRDFALIELVRMMNPVMYEEISRNARYFMFARWRLTSWLEVVNPDEKIEQKMRNSYFDVLFRDLPRPPEGTLLGLVKEIFPPVNSYLSGADIPVHISQGSDEAERQRKIYHPDFFARYFIFQVPQDLFGEKDLSNFISAMNGKNDVAQCATTFISKYEGLHELPMKRSHFLHRVDISIERLSHIAAQALPVALSDLSNRLGDFASGSFDEITARRIVFTAANRLRGTLGAQTILENVIRDAKSDIFATQILNDCGPNKKPALRDWAALQRDKLDLVFRERMNAKYGPVGKQSFFPMDDQSHVVPLGRWALCGTKGQEEVHEYLLREFHARHSNVGDFLRQFFLAEHTDATDDPRTHDPLAAIKIYFPPEELAKLLSDYGDSAYSSQDEARAIKEFKSRYEGTSSG
jgi:KAP-like P-loop domain-containing protein